MVSVWILYPGTDFYTTEYCLFVGLVLRPANSSMTSSLTAQGHAFHKLFYAAGAVTASLR